MSTQFIDLRMHARVFFGTEDPIEGHIAIAETAGSPFPVTFLSLSEGGLSFLCDRELALKLHRDQVIAIHTPGTGPMQFLNGVACQARYVLQSEEMPQATVGCQFRELTGSAHHEIKKIVKSRQQESQEEKSRVPL